MLVSGITNNFEYIPDASDSKESACNAGDLGSIPRSGRSPGEGNGYPLQDSCLENPMDRGAWGASVHRVATVGHKWATNTFTFHSHHVLESNSSLFDVVPNPQTTPWLKDWTVLGIRGKQLPVRGSCPVSSSVWGGRAGVVFGAH